MGASFQSAWVTARHLHSLGIPALAVEAAEVLHYGLTMARKGSPLVFISQSGASAEVVPVIESLPRETLLLAVTNDVQSQLAQRARVVFPLLAGEETLVASKTYVNSLATLWLMARRWGGLRDGDEVEALSMIVDAIEHLLQQPETTAARWMDELGAFDTLLFAGHGPHAATARQAAMAVSEWAKVPALNASVGAFRHGFVEIARPGLGVVIFAAPGRTHASARALATELSGYGARVLLIQNGHTRSVSETGQEQAKIDEFLSPILDIIPVQIFMDALARQRGITPGFRYISKVVTQL